MGLLIRNNCRLCVWVGGGVGGWVTQHFVSVLFHSACLFLSADAFCFQVFKARDALMSRANSLKKAVRQIIEHTEKGEGSRVSGIEPGLRLGKCVHN